MVTIRTFPFDRQAVSGVKGLKGKEKRQWSFNLGWIVFESNCRSVKARPG
jgi:hypothetical protein